MEKNRRFERFNEYKLGWLRDSLFFIAAIAVVFVLFRFVIGLSVVGGDSMDPTLKDSNIVMYLRIGGDYSRGDVVSMRVPSGDYYIKRNDEKRGLIFIFFGVSSSKERRVTNGLVRRGCFLSHISAGASRSSLV